MTDQLQTQDQPVETQGERVDNPDMPPLVVGPPFALSTDCELLSKGEAAPGCVAVVQCDRCTQRFRMDLLTDTIKKCPQCSMAYTHMLLVAPEPDTDIVAAAMAQVLEANGYEVPDDDDDDDDDNDEPSGANEIPDAG